MLLLKVGPHSAGNYSCSSHKSNTATVSINVVDGGRKSYKLTQPDLLLTSGELTPEAMLEEDMKLVTSGSPHLTLALSLFLLAWPLSDVHHWRW